MQDSRDDPGKRRYVAEKIRKFFLCLEPVSPPSRHRCGVFGCRIEFGLAGTGLAHGRIEKDLRDAVVDLRRGQK